MQSLKRLIHEVHRRSLWQVLAIYLAGSFVALQVVNEVAEAASMPGWVSGVAIILLVLGLPVVLATAFVQEGGPRAAATSDNTDGSADTAGQRVFTWRNAMVGGGAAFIILVGAAAAWFALDRGTVAVQDAELLRSVAVLPFATRSDKPEDVYFAEGMHDDLLTQLSKIDSLTVISRTSVVQYAKTEKRIPEIAQELGVNAIVEGGIQRSGTRIRVNVQLIDAAHDRHLWAQTYDEELTAENVFTIQSDLARKIAQALRATLTPSVERRIAARPTESLAAWELYSSARYAYVTRGSYGEDLEAIRAQFRAALDEDPDFAAAWTGLADTYLAAANWVRMPTEQALPLARDAIMRAIAADPDLAEAHIAHARLLRFEGKIERAEQELLRAKELNPGMSEVHAAYANLLEDMRKPEEAAEAARLAVQYDPMSLAARNTLADRYFFAGRWNEAAEESKKAIMMAPTDWYAWYNLGWSHAALGQVPDGIAAFHESARHTQANTATIRAGLAYTYAKGGQRDSALHYLAAAEAAADDPAEVGYDVALVRFTLGDTDEAFAALERLLAGRLDRLLRFEIDPTAAPMRADRRFAELAKRIRQDAPSR